MWGAWGWQGLIWKKGQLLPIEFSETDLTKPIPLLSNNICFFYARLSWPQINASTAINASWSQKNSIWVSLHQTYKSSDLEVALQGHSTSSENSLPKNVIIVKSPPVLREDEMGIRQEDNQSQDLFCWLQTKQKTANNQNFSILSRRVHSSADYTVFFGLAFLSFLPTKTLLVFTVSHIVWCSNGEHDKLSP